MIGLNGRLSIWLSLPWIFQRSCAIPSWNVSLRSHTKSLSMASLASLLLLREAFVKVTQFSITYSFCVLTCCLVFSTKQSMWNIFKGWKLLEAHITYHTFKFTDDSLLFTRISQNEAASILDILDTYQKSSRYVVKMGKFETRWWLDLYKCTNLLIK
jgi:hypothetical protein